MLKTSYNFDGGSIKDGKCYNARQILFLNLHESVYIQLSFGFLC